MTTDQGYNTVGTANGRKKKKVAIIAVSGVILVAMVVAVAVGVTHSRRKSHSGGNSQSEEVSTSMKAVKAVCEPTDYKEICVNKLSSAAGNATDPKDLIKVGFQVTMEELNNIIKNSSTYQELLKDPSTAEALQNCKELMEYSIDDLKNSFDQLGEFDVSKLDSYVENLKVWLSGAITFQETCVDGFDNTSGNAAQFMRDTLKTARELTSNGLAMVTEISNALGSMHGQTGSTRRLLSGEDGEIPSWVGEKERVLIESGGFFSNVKPKPNVVVAKDGSGQYKTINDALKKIPPRKDNSSYVIHIKAGVYTESVMVDKNMHHIVMIGDGPTKTKITGAKNYADGTKTFQTATVSIIGPNFIGKDLTIENAAGAVKHQAVALRVQSDQSIFYNCQFDGYQDTLYTHAHRQFYRDCTITGTIDFIFGDAAVVFQNCRILIRRPGPNQQCIVTAQGRTDKRQPTAIVLQNCIISADRDYLPMKNTLKSYLARPWKEYSRTIIMQSQIDDFISPDGFLPWAGDFGLNTLFYSEFDNRGPGSNTTQRVKWNGIKTITPQQAADFTPGRFLVGDTWIKPTGVPYVSGMIKV